jgi:hypothetical protein
MDQKERDVMQKELGKVKSVDLFVEDHGILTLYVHLDFGGSGQGFGGIALDSYSEKDKERVGTASGLDFILRILRLFGVDRLEQIKGRSVFALRAGEAGMIEGLELPAFDGGKRFLIDDWKKRWEPEFAALKKAAGR